MTDEKSSAGRYPRILIGAAASGSGKTTLVCGLLEAFLRRGISCASFKCGPDYIDPMFHRYVLGVPGCNLDSWFLEEDAVQSLFAEKAAEKLSVIEGVMGYYDGVAGISTRASTYDIARITDTPAILILDGRRSSLSLAAQLAGFMTYKKDSRIAGVILNRTSPAMAERLRPCLEEVGAKLFGAVPECAEAQMESRHLGLVLPGEQRRLRERIGLLAERLETCLDLDGILRLAKSAGDPGDVAGDPGDVAVDPGDADAGSGDATAGSDGAAVGSGGSASRLGDTAADPAKAAARRLSRPLRVGLALDEAFCFYYRDNLDVLSGAGCELIPFSPLADQKLPEHLDALLFGGGYPELCAKRLSENAAMLQAVRDAREAGVKILAECGGFLYLHRTLEGEDQKVYPMAGLIPADAYRTERLSRFGYIELSGDPGTVRGHEFHYWDSTAPGEAMEAKKPLSDRSWRCMYADEGMLAGFPHLCYRSAPEFILSFLEGKEGRP